MQNLTLVRAPQAARSPRTTGRRPRGNCATNSGSTFHRETDAVRQQTIAVLRETRAQLSG
jgi:hypothetical protein